MVENRDDPGAIDVRASEQDVRALIEGAFGRNKLTLQDSGAVMITDDRLGVEVEMLPADPGAPPDPELVTIALTEKARDGVLESSSDFRRLLKAIERAAVLEMNMVDDETPFKETGKPYLRALFDAGFVTQGMGISVNFESDYGKPDKGGVVVTEPVTYVAEKRETLERFFNTLPPEWRIPKTHRVAYGHMVIPRRNAEPLQLWRTYIIKDRADITGERIKTASVGYKQDTGTPQVEVSFDKIGARDFDRMSGDNVGRKMAIIMDDIVVSDPIFNERIPNGNVVITLGNSPGESVRQQANDLVKVLKSGSLPARLNKEFEIRVGADLGKESVERGFKAFLVGLGLVVLFMGIYYRRAGRIAVFALIMNMILVLAAMAMFQATLTLPGIAGIVLTHRHGRRRQRHHLRARPRVPARGLHRPRGDRGRLRPGVHDHPRLAADHRDRGPGAVAVRLRADSRLRHHAADRHRHLDLHRGVRHSGVLRLASQPARLRQGLDLIGGHEHG